MSETRQLARSLVEPEPATFDSRHPRAESIERIRTAAHGFELDLDGEHVVIAARNARYEGKWEGSADALRLDGEFIAGPRVKGFLKAISAMMVLLIAASAWILWSGGDESPARFLVPLVTLLAIFGLPFVVSGMASAREADKSRIRKALRVALQDEEERMPKMQKWDDEQ